MDIDNLKLAQLPSNPAERVTFLNTLFDGLEGSTTVRIQLIASLYSLPVTYLMDLAANLKWNNRALSSYVDRHKKNTQDLAMALSGVHNDSDTVNKAKYIVANAIDIQVATVTFYKNTIIEIIKSIEILNINYNFNTKAMSEYDLDTYNALLKALGTYTNLISSVNSTSNLKFLNSIGKIQLSNDISAEDIRAALDKVKEISADSFGDDVDDSDLFEEITKHA